MVPCPGVPQLVRGGEGLRRDPLGELRCCKALARGVCGGRHGGREGRGGRGILCGVGGGGRGGEGAVGAGSSGARAHEGMWGWRVGGSWEGMGMAVCAEARTEEEWASESCAERLAGERCECGSGGGCLRHTWVFKARTSCVNAAARPGATEPPACSKTSAFLLDIDDLRSESLCIYIYFTHGNRQ